MFRTKEIRFCKRRLQNLTTFVLLLLEINDRITCEVYIQIQSFIKKNFLLMQEKALPKSELVLM